MRSTPHTSPPLRLSTRLRALVLLVAFAAGGAVHWAQLSVIDSRSKDERARVSQLASAQAFSLHGQLDQSLAATVALGVAVRESGGIDDFEGYAQEVLDAYKGITNLQLAPDGVVTKIHPVEGNEAAIGHDLLADPERNAEAFAAIEERTLTLAGPFTLLQGGVAMVGRLPVFVDDERGGDQFWGFASALIRLEDYLDAANIEQLRDAGLDYRLSRVEIGTEQISSFAGEERIDDPVSVEMQVPNGTWTLSVAPSSGWGGTPTWIWLISLIVMASTLVMARSMARRPLVLEEEIRLRTTDLEESNRSLENEVENHRQTSSDLRRRELALRRARDAAESANRAKSEFLTQMSHDLRTPLHALMGFSQLLAEDLGDDPDHREALAQITLSSHRLLELVNETIEVSAEDSSSLHRHERFDVVQLITDLASPGRVAAGIRVDVRGGPVEAVGDPQVVRQVLDEVVGELAALGSEQGTVDMTARPSTTGTIIVAQLRLVDQGPTVATEDLHLSMAVLDELARPSGVRLSVVDQSGPTTGPAVHLFLPADIQSMGRDQS